MEMAKIIPQIVRKFDVELAFPKKEWGKYFLNWDDANRSSNYKSLVRQTEEYACKCLSEEVGDSM